MIAASHGPKRGRARPLVSWLPIQVESIGRVDDAQTETYTDLVKAGIIDPTKVVRTALVYAASVAGLLITTEAMVAEKPEDKSAMPAMPPGGMGDMGGMM